MAKKILIVEDEEKNRKLFSVILKQSGYETIEAENGEQGIELAKDTNPDLILMDIQLPAMDGITATKILKSDPSTKKIPVIALTAYAMIGDKEKLIGEGFDDYISKPIDMKEFKEVIGEYILRDHS